MYRVKVDDVVPEKYYGDVARVIRYVMSLDSIYREFELSEEGVA
jgi:flagellar biosynthesis protein FlhB